MYGATAPRSHRTLRHGFLSLSTKRVAGGADIEGWQRYRRIRTAPALGVVVAIGADLSGAGPPAACRAPCAVRGTGERRDDSGARWGGAHGLHAGKVGTWVDAHRRWITISVLLVLALVFALWNHPTVLMVLLMAIILLAVLTVVALLAAGGRHGEPTKRVGER